MTDIQRGAFESDLLQLFSHVAQLNSFAAHQLDVSVSHDGAELAQVPHHPVENLGDAFPLVAAHVLDPGQLHLQSHEVCLWRTERKSREREGKKDEKKERRQADNAIKGAGEGVYSGATGSRLTCETLTQPYSHLRNPGGKI